MQNKVVRLHASGGDNRFRARFSQSLTDCQRPSVRYRVAGGFLVWFSFRFVFTVARENKRENGGGGRRGAAGENHLHLACIQLSPRPSLFGSTSGPLSRGWSLTERTTEGKKHTQKQTTSYSGYSERKEYLRKTAIISHRPLFPFIYLLSVFFCPV